MKITSIDNEDDHDKVDLPTLDNISLDKNEGVPFIGRILALWKKRWLKLLHDYAGVGYILSLHHVIIKDKRENMSMEDKEAAKRLITKIFIPVNVVGKAWVTLQAKLIHQFWKEYCMSNFCILFCLCQLLTFHFPTDDFKNKTGSPHLGNCRQCRCPCLSMAQVLINPQADCPWPYCLSWTQRYLRLGALREFGRWNVVCLGIVQTCKEKLQRSKQQLPGFMHKNNKQDLAQKAKAVLLWDDKDFNTVKMDALCLIFDVSPPEELQRWKT